MSDLLITQFIGQTALEKLEQASITYRQNQKAKSFDRDQLIEATRGVTAVICLLTDTFDDSVMDALPDLRLIANVAVGYDNIDLDAATQRGILVTNTPDVLTETTADLAFGLILAAARRIPEADCFMRAGKYSRFELYPEMLGADVYGKTLGIVGMGRIGTAVARRGALGFNMPILYSGHRPNQEAEQSLNAQFVSFDALLAESDFISINVPLTSDTTHLFTYETIKKMKPSAFLINTARGPVIKEADLLKALEEGIIAGAALDVFEFEPEISSKMAQMSSRLVVTPHIGSATRETRQNMADIAVENVLAFFSGHRPPTLLNPKVWNAR